MDKQGWITSAKKKAPVMHTYLIPEVERPRVENGRFAQVLLSWDRPRVALFDNHLEEQGHEVFECLQPAPKSGVHHRTIEGEEAA